ncbi:MULTISPECIES: GNAT family N-acetyltransferase [unclassified Lysinibacillus]|uniref:GNAT family N-acetyltransferase n=1 Tax=unclassified Lysinibacillus TaxID=2636778 RepID=UPI00116D00CF|nr:GNAT family N-acetyltransferase [Lysinibacillus sp. CD3-6]QPQ34533.1 GNAT family N-acetyltransferase [Lysinibacillus sp. JNUCC-52]UED79493.1 GNAT family N-acetyltransferase [Lysinibacillus sp. CD3-6]
MIVRKAIYSDAEKIVNVMANAEESGFMLFSPQERAVNPEKFAKYIDTTHRNPKAGVFVACVGEQIVGYLIVQNEKPIRIAHRANIVIGVHSESRGQGVGKALFTHVIAWAQQVELHRLDLTVIASNDVAVHLYKKMGFEIEGVKRHSLCIDGQFVDEYFMSLLL